MKRAVLYMVLMLSLTSWAVAQSNEPPNEDGSAVGWLDTFRATIQKHLGRPYVWGASGIKSFDCSGFLWRVLYDNGILMKRTTARKFYMLLPAASEEEHWNFGTVVFFDNLKHVGIVDNSDAFYHAQVSRERIDRR